MNFLKIFFGFENNLNPFDEWSKQIKDMVEKNLNINKDERAKKFIKEFVEILSRILSHSESEKYWYSLSFYLKLAKEYRLSEIRFIDEWTSSRGNKWRGNISIELAKMGISEKDALKMITYFQLTGALSITHINIDNAVLEIEVNDLIRKIY